MRTVRRMGWVLGAALVAAGFALALWPLHANGVSGSALQPHYSGYYVAFSSYGPLPDHPSADDLRRAGVRLPQDVVASRRHRAEGLAVAGVVLLGVAFLAGRRRPGANEQPGATAGA